MLRGYRFSLQPVLQGLAWLVSHFAVSLPGIGRIGPGPWIAKQLHHLDRLILSGLSYGVDASAEAIVSLWHGTAKLAEWMAQEIANLARDTANAVEGLAGHGLRRFSKAIQRLISAAVGSAYRRLLKLMGLLTHGLGRRIIALVRELAAATKFARHWVGFTAKALRAMLRRLGKLGWLAGVGGLAALGHLIFKRLGIRWLTGHKSLAALGIAMLARLGLSFLRCGNVKTAGKRLCNLDPNSFDSLFAGLIAIVGTVSVVEFIRDAQAIEDEAIASLKFFIREL